MSTLSQIVSALRTTEPDYAEIRRMMHRLDENFVSSNADATGLWNLRSRIDLGPLKLESYRVAILSNTTQDFFLPHLYAAGLACGLDLDICWLGAGRIVDVALTPSSDLYAAEPNVVFLSWDQEQKLAGVLYSSLEPAPRMQAAREFAAEISSVVAQITERMPAARIVLHTMHWFHPSILGFSDEIHRDVSNDVTEFLNQELRALARACRNVHLLDMQRVVGTVGFAQWRNNARWFGGSIDTVNGNVGLAREYVRFVKSFTKRIRKIIVVDLDNTLWGGLAGEDGVGGVCLGGGYPGNVYRQFQCMLKLYSKRGTLLAINSKNNRADAIAIMEQHPDMVLGASDFVAMEINWHDKATNMLSIARDLDLDLNSFVFIDDSPQERELIRQALPQVLVPEFPSSVADLPYLLEGLNDFDYESFTDTDRQRTQLYRTESLRRDLRKSVTSLDEYLAMLETKVSIAAAGEVDIGRIEQLFQRTNQFNTTTRRYSRGELAAFAGSANHALTMASVSDRFGDHGIVAAALLRLGETAVIDSLLMSCRVIGRGVETAMLAYLASMALERGYSELHAEYLPTSKNLPSRDVFVNNGFLSEGRIEKIELFKINDLGGHPLRTPNHITLCEAPRG